MLDDVLKEAEHKMTRSVETGRAELSGIRTGRANPALLTHLTVEYYGAPTQLQQIASVTAPEPRLLVIQPYDRSAMPAIEKAIQRSELGLNPGNDGPLIRVPIPPLTEERRRDYVKLVHKIAEEARIAIRNVRRDEMATIKEMEREHKVSADEAKRAEEQLQRLTDRHTEEVDLMSARKEAEVLEV
jgi:ribosome recycling factor